MAGGGGFGVAGGRFSGGGFGGGRVGVAQADEDGADQTALISEARGEGFGDDASGGRGFDAVGAMFFGVEFFVRGGGKGHQADAARGLAAGLLELADLGGELGVAGADGGVVEGEDVVENAGENLEPIGFGAAQFFNFQAQGAFLGIVELHLELVEVADFIGHALGDILGGGDGFIGIALGGLLDKGPLGGGGGDLFGIFFEVGQGLGGGGEGGEFEPRAGGAVIEEEREAAEEAADGGAADGDIDIGMRNGAARVVNDGGGHEDKQDVRKEEWPLGGFPHGDFVHSFSVGKMRA